jgi:glycosyltransferase involved in cell wall biosynthesis
MTITICICTKNRPSQLKRCIRSILKSTILPDEIIIINEGETIDENFILGRFVSKIKIINYPASNLSKGRNHAISIATSDIVCFTDDDCIIDSQWIQKCLETFKYYHSCMGVFGAIKPYQPNKHNHEICSCTFKLCKQKVISKPCYHAAKIGFGNNMAFRKEIFNKIGNFKTWLGVGSIGDSAEDAEFALRILIKKNIIIHNPDMVVFHNKWLSDKQIRSQHLLYFCGEIACYGYFFFLGQKFARPIIMNNLKSNYLEICRLLKKTILLRWDRGLASDIKWVSANTLYGIKGLTIALYYSFVDPIR